MSAATFYRADGVTAQDAGHAWAEAYVDKLGWVGFDPTNGISPTDAHVRVAVGLDYLGAAPVRGTRYGGGGETLEVTRQCRSGQRQSQAQSQSQRCRSRIAVAHRHCDAPQARSRKKQIHMTYCCGILVRDGLVMIADTRTNAGLDNVSTFRKLHVYTPAGRAHHGARLLRQPVAQPVRALDC